MGTVVEENCVRGYPVLRGGGIGVWPMVAKPCDFCKPDSPFLCVACDALIHAANKLTSRHERLWMCELCEQVPAVTYKADAAALCVSCDADIHSANPLSRRQHERVRLIPFYESADAIIKKSSAANADSASGNGSNLVNFLVPGADEEEDQIVDVSWFLPPLKAAASGPSEGRRAGELFFSHFDHLLEFENPNQVYLNFKNNQRVTGSDSVVPAVRIKSEIVSNTISSDPRLDIDFCKSKHPFYNFDVNSQSINQSVSSTSMDIGLVPDSSAASDISYALKNPIGCEVNDVKNLSATQAKQLTGLDREARVLRYREKRKNRKFEKTIRYASRKAYAETRPRVKGRFVKRTEPDQEFDRMFNNSSMDFFKGYGVVPSY